MERVNVQSSNISSIGYGENILEVEFNNRSIYQYYNVPESIYMGLINADSHGTYLNSVIKKSYTYRRVS